MQRLRSSTPKIVWLLSLCCFALGCSQQFILGVPTQVASSLGVSLPDVGPLMTAFGVANAIGTPVILAFTSHLEQKRLLIIGLATVVLGLSVTALTSTYGVLVCARVVKGMGHGIFVATSYAVAQRLAPAGREASAMANVALGFSLAQVLGMPIARFATSFFDWHTLYGALAVCAFVAMIAIIRFVPSTPGDVSGNVGLRNLVEPFSNAGIRLVLLATVVTQVGYMGFYTYVTPYLETELGSDGHTVSVLLLVMGVLCIVGTKASGPVSVRLGARATVLLSLICQVAMYIVMLACSAFAPGLMAALCVWIAFAWMFLPPQNFLASRMSPEHVSIVIALITSSLQLGGAIGSAVGSLYIGMAPLSSLPVLGAVFTAVSIAIEALATRNRHVG